MPDVRARWTSMYGHLILGLTVVYKPQQSRQHSHSAWCQICVANKSRTIVYVGAALPPLPEKSDMNIVHVLHQFVMQRICFKEMGAGLQNPRI